MKIDIVPSNLSTLNCIQVAITNILLYKKYSEYKTVWKDFNFGYKKEQDQLFGSLFSTTLLPKDELEWIHGIKLITITKHDTNEFLKEIKNHLDNGEPIMLDADIYFLKYHTSYQKKHGGHIITLTNYVDNRITCVDHSQHHIGEMSEEELIIASNKINTYTYSYIDLQNSKTILLEDDYKNIIESAYNNIK
ncbi:BtrH N-terminal domain-containing protein, partial [Heyndrickxia sporothermodurans]